MDARDLFARAQQEFAGRVHAVGDQWTAPTPCDDWDVRALVGHVVGENRWMTPMLAGRTIADVGDELDGDLLGADPIAAWDAASAEARAAVAADGALDATVHLSYGDTPAGDYVTEVGFDHFVHAWDLACATGGDERLDPELVAFYLHWFGPREDAWRRAGVIGPAVEVRSGDDPQTRLLARLGRRR